MSRNLNNKAAAVIKARRNELGLSQERLADLCSLDRTYISSVERLRRNLTLDTLEKIVSGLDISPEAFLQKLIDLEDDPA